MGTDEIGPLAGFAASAFVVIGTLLHFQVFPHPPTAVYLVALIPVGVVLLLPKATVLAMPISVPPLLIVAWISISSAWTFDADRTAFLLRVELPLLVGFLIIAAVMQGSDVMALLLWAGRIALLITVAATIAVPASRSGSQLDGQALAGWHGLFPHKNDMGPFFAIFLAVVLVADRRRVTRYPTLVTIAIVLVGSQSVTALSTALVVVAGYVWLQANRNVDDRVLSITMISTIAMAIGAALGLRAGLPIFLDATGKDPTFSGRTDIWSAVSGAIGERPWLGYGRGGLFFSPPNERSIELWREIGFRAPHAHNGVLDLTSQIGLVGLGLFIVLLAQTIRSSVRSYRRGEHVGIFALAVVISIVVASLSEPAFLGPYLTVVCVLRVMTLKLDRAAQLATLRNIAAARPRMAGTATRQLQPARVGR